MSRTRGREAPYDLKSDPKSPRTRRSTASRPASASSPRIRINHPSRAPSFSDASSTATRPASAIRFPEDVVRGGHDLRANTLSKGYSGVRLKLVDTVIDMINKGVVPYINEKGSVGTERRPLAPVAVRRGRHRRGPGVLQGRADVRRRGDEGAGVSRPI
jgi:hypothetical protein